MRAGHIRRIRQDLTAAWVHDKIVVSELSMYERVSVTAFLLHNKASRNVDRPEKIVITGLKKWQAGHYCRDATNQRCVFTLRIVKTKSDPSGHIGISKS